MTKIKQTTEKLVSICRTVGMQTFYEGVCCTYVYIIFAKSSCFLFPTGRSCDWTLFLWGSSQLQMAVFQTKQAWFVLLIASLLTKGDALADLCATHSRNCSRPGPAGTDGEPCSTVTSIVDLLGQDVSPHGSRYRCNDFAVNRGTQRTPNIILIVYPWESGGVGMSKTS